MDAGKRTINDIFNGNRVLEIPFFQRAYVWGKNQWERLLEDMELVSSSNKPYFLGSVILKQQQTHSSNAIGDMRTLIDGQQRLTTLNIFFKVLCLKTGKNSSFERRFKLENDRVALWHNHNDIRSFEKVLNLQSLEDIKGDNNILEAYNFFKENADPAKLDWQTILNNIMFVGIDLGVDEDEQQIFDTINSLGVRLTTAELLKNYFFSRNELSEYDTYWKNIFEKDDDTKRYWDRGVTAGRFRRTFIDLFFYSFLQIKIQQDDLKVRTEDKLEYSKVETLFDSYKNFIKGYGIDKKALLAEIKVYAELFRENFDADIVDRELTAEYGIERINAIIFGLDTTTLIPYILYVLKNVQDQQQQADLFEFIESYVMRRIVVNATTKNYNQLFTDRLISNQILSKEQFQEFLSNQDDRVNYLPNNKELKRGFDEVVLINKQAAGIIYFLESKIRNRSRQATQLLGISRYSLEHLMPKKWENKWPSVATKEEKDTRNFKLKTLGNLAIITQSLNASIRDSDWQTKRHGNGNRQGLIHFSGGIETLAPYLAIDDWNEEEIQKRANSLYDIATEVWKEEESLVAS
ncbi:DUF262 domain-containing protein [Pontibacter vulgaris]|uniref:DUF262 domain-containing protein n=1 Tax=Pontibacter vulgaris TaxID=2905679 RepID=UPI001FA7A4A2|nr:DUF262 domain-containing protein [Pontibacter vulgaris]